MGAGYVPRRAGVTTESKSSSKESDLYVLLPEEAEPGREVAGREREGGAPAPSGRATAVGEPPAAAAAAVAAVFVAGFRGGRLSGGRIEPMAGAVTGKVVARGIAGFDADEGDGGATG